MLIKKCPGERLDLEPRGFFRWVHPSLYEGVSVRPSVRPSVGQSDGRMVRNLFFFSNAKNGQFSLGKSSGQSKFDIAECAECSECA